MCACDQTLTLSYGGEGVNVTQLQRSREAVCERYRGGCCVAVKPRAVYTFSIQNTPLRNTQMESVCNLCGMARLMDPLTVHEGNDSVYIYCIYSILYTVCVLSVIIRTVTLYFPVKES